MTTTWSQRLAILDELIKGSGNRTFRIATELRAICRDREFLAECKNVIEVRDSRLKKYAGATGRSLGELLQMIDHFPDENDWEDGDLHGLYQKTAQQIARKMQSNRVGSCVPREQKPGKPIASSRLLPVAISPAISELTEKPLSPPALSVIQQPPILTHPSPPPLPPTKQPTPQRQQPLPPTPRPSGMHMVYVNQLITLIETNSLDLENDELMLRLQVLHAQLENLFVTVQK